MSMRLSCRYPGGTGLRRGGDRQRANPAGSMKASFLVDEDMPRSTARALMAALASLGDESLAGTLVVVEPVRIRIHR